MSDLIFEKSEQVGIIRLNRPDSLNAFSLEMIEMWIESLERIRDDEDIFVGIVTGNGKAFCAGGDITSLIKGEGFMKKSPSSEHDFKTLPIHTKNSLWKYIQRIPLLMEEIDKPMIAAINGTAIGAGLDMALMCDMRFCSDQAKLGEGYINVGIVPGDGGGYYLPRIIGMDKALEMFWTGDIISADRAKEIGLVTRVFPHDQLLEETMRFADRLTQKPQQAIRMTKRVAYQGQSMTLRQSLDMVSSFMALAVHHPEHEHSLAQLSKKFRK